TRRGLQAVHDACLDRLVLGVGDQALVEHLLRRVEAFVGVAGRGGEVGGSAVERAADVDAPRLGTELVEVAHAALLAPRLLLGLTERVDLLRLFLTEAIDADGAAGVAARGEIVARERGNGERGAEHAGADARIVEVLPANVVGDVAAEESARERDEAAARGADDDAAMREREEATLHGVGADRLAGHEERAQLRERRLDAPWAESIPLVVALRPNAARRRSNDSHRASRANDRPRGP